MYSNLLNLLLFSFFFSFVKKEKGKRAVANAGRRLRPKQERESQACLRAFFLSEKSTLFAVSGFAAQCRGPAFFVYGRAAGASGGPAADGPRVVCVRNRGQSNIRGATREKYVEKGKKVISLFLGERSEGCLPVFQVEVEIGAQLSRPWGIGTAVKTSRARVAARVEHGMEDPAGGGLWPPSQLIQLIYLRYLCGSAEWKKRMDVCFLLTLYI